MDLSDHLPGTLDDGRYIVGEILGQGGMAVVCLAFDRELGVDRAVKILVPGSAKRDTVRRRLKAEARAMARLQHPNILAIHDVGVQDGLDYVVMDYAEGGSLQNRLEDGPLDPQDAARIMVQVLSALAAAHTAGIVHRDVKPHNILLDRNGRAQLADFGIALLSDDERRTRTGVAMGSVSYMPPEQRLDAARVTTAADIYAAGSTLFALITRENPVDLFMADEDSPRWERVPEPIRNIIRRACRRHPEERWANAGEMAGALADLLQTTLLDTPIPIQRSAVAPPFRVPTAVTPDAEATAEALRYLEHNLTVGPDGPGTSPVPAGFAAYVPTTGAETAIGEPPEPFGQPWTSPAVLLAVGALVVVALLFLWTGMQLGETPEPDGVVAAPIPETPAPTVPAVPEPAPVPEPVEPVVEPVPAPVPVAAPPPRPDGRHPVAGAWGGTLGGIVVEVVLTATGSNVSGTFTSTFGPNTQSSRLSGTWDALTRSLALRDDDAHYELALESDGRLAGRVTNQAGGVRTLVLRRAP
ncbi:MAG: serine/threonine protein kinase [Alphaproteobacteria bacterium]|nr:serine/threonine protein kinase [Alphaproteobacteria bacterium]